MKYNFDEIIDRKEITNKAIRGRLFVAIMTHAGANEISLCG